MNKKGIISILASLAFSWLSGHWLAPAFSGLGIIAAIIIHKYGFSKIAMKNIQRITYLKEKRNNIFAFQSLKSYILIVFMMALGAYLRHSIIPIQYIAIIYLAIGGALFLSSLKYYTSLVEFRYYKSSKYQKSK